MVGRAWRLTAATLLVGALLVGASAPALASPELVTGSLLLPDRSPVTTAGRVRAYEGSPAVLAEEVAVGVDGTWSMALEPGQYVLSGTVVGDEAIAESEVVELTVTWQGRLAVAGSPHLGLDDSPLELTTRPATVVGTVLDAELQPVGDATLDGPGGPYHVWTGTGRFTAAMPAGGHDVWVHAAGLPFLTTQLTAPATAASLTMPAATLTGTVVSSSAEPVRGVLVEVDGADPTRTDAAGRFGVDVPDGTYDVRFSVSGEATQLGGTTTVQGVEVVGGTVVGLGGSAAASVDVVLDTPNVVGDVLLPSGSGGAPPGTRVLLDDGGGSGPFTDWLDGGTFSLSAPDGAFTLRVAPPAWNPVGWGAVDVPVVISGGAVVEVDGIAASAIEIVLPAANVVGEVRDVADGAVANAHVGWDQPFWGTGENGTDADGHFQIHLPDGVHHLTASEFPVVYDESNFDLATVTVEVVDGEVVRPTAIVLRQQLGNVEITVTDPVSLLPLAGVQVLVDPGTSCSCGADGRTGEDGTFRFNAVDQAGWHILVRPWSGAGVATHVYVDVVGGLPVVVSSIAGIDVVDVAAPGP